MKSVFSISSKHFSVLVGVVLMLCLFALNGAALAQNNSVTQDEVNAVAEQMYCPVCENIPLDDCGTPTCVQWKEEIRVLLTEGKTASQIVDEFVVRYGEQVVGIPQNVGLQALSFVIPVLGVLVAIVIGVMTFSRWRHDPRKTKMPEDDEAMTASGTENEDYRARLERDLQ